MALRNNLKATLKRCRESEDNEFTFDDYGLTFRLKQTRGGMVVLVIERKNTAATDADWDYVVSQWPEPGPGGIVPEPKTEGRTRKLVGRWPRPAGVLDSDRREAGERA